MSSGSDKIVSTILSEAQNKADEIIQKAELEAKSLEEKKSKIANFEKEKILDDANKQSKMRYQQIVSEAKMKSRRLELETREEVIEESFNKATEELKKIALTSDKEYVESLKGIIEEAAIEINGGDLIIYTKEEDINKIKSLVGSIENNVKSTTGNDTKFEFGDPINTIGGAILKTKNGEIEVNNTIEARLLRYKKDLRSQVAKILFD
jgi:V/A-type H+-transporting ATPase subunit E